MRWRECLLMSLMIFPWMVPGQSSSPKDAVLGTWRGTSICTKVPGNEACRDENVIYEFRSKGGRNDFVTLKGDKVVNDKIVPMYEIECTYDAKQNRWISEFQNSRVHILWSYVVHDSTITGTCVDLPSKVVRRNVVVHKVQANRLSASGVHSETR